MITKFTDLQSLREALENKGANMQYYSKYPNLNQDGVLADIFRKIEGLENALGTLQRRIHELEMGFIRGIPFPAEPIVAKTITDAHPAAQSSFVLKV
jgi:hypothetical protein